MRWVCAVLFLAASARADVALPGASQGVTPPPAPLRTRCAQSLLDARRQLARVSGAFERAVVDEFGAPGADRGPVARVELRLDETLLDADDTVMPFLVVAEVSSRDNLWADPGQLHATWTPNRLVRAGTTSTYRQTVAFEGEVATVGLPPSVAREKLLLAVETILKPAVDQCLRRFD